MEVPAETALPMCVSDQPSPQELIYHNYVKRKIEEGIKAVDDGRVVSHDEVKRLFARLRRNLRQ